MVQITQVCKYFIFLAIIFKFSLSLSNNLEPNQYGNYLSWEHAKDSNDTINLKRFFKNINLEKLDDVLLEEIFFEAVILEDWAKAENISNIILTRDKNNFSANLYKFFDGHKNGFYVDEHLEQVNPKYLDLNFLKAIKIWKNSEEQLNIPFEPNSCIPIICLHSAIFYFLKGDEVKTKNFLEKVEEKEFESYRVKELLLYYSIILKKNNSHIYLTQLNQNDLNLRNFDLEHLADHKYLLNPILNKDHGMAEVLYNISSWFYSKNLLKYSAFFGKISLRLRPEFNAMKLLLSGSLEQLGYENIGFEYVDNQSKDNLYYYKFLRIKLSFLEGQKLDKQFLSNLIEFTQSFPDKKEMKVLLGDKYRKMEKYKEAIKIYSEIINNEELLTNWNVLYSRGISYERINEWKKAEIDLKKALKLNPENAYVLNYLAYSWLDRNKNIDEALKLLKKAVQIEPTDAYIIDSLGWAYFLSNQTEESVYFLEKAVSILPDDATLNDHLGDAYWKAGREREALSQWKRVLILDPNFKNKIIINKKIKEGL